jgi:hypothetical protein
MAIPGRSVRAQRTAAARVLAYATVLQMALLYGLYRGDLAHPGGPSPVVTLLVGLPALPVFVTQRVRSGKPAFLIALLAGLGSCFAIAAVLGFNQDWADYAGIAAGTVVFDLVFWWRSREGRLSAA